MERLRHLIKKEKQLIRAIKQSKIRLVRHAKKYMFGFLIPRNYTEAFEFEKANNNSKWHDASKTELDSIHSYQVFEEHEKAQYDKQKKVINAPPGYQKIRVHLIFAVKYDGRHKARLVADGHLTPEPVESIYSGEHLERLKRIYAYVIRSKDYATRFRTTKPDYSYLPD